MFEFPEFADGMRLVATHQLSMLPRLLRGGALLCRAASSGKNAILLNHPATISSATERTGAAHSLRNSSRRLEFPEFPPEEAPIHRAHLVRWIGIIAVAQPSHNHVVASGENGRSPLSEELKLQA